MALKLVIYRNKLIQNVMIKLNYAPHNCSLRNFLITPRVALDCYVLLAACIVALFSGARLLLLVVWLNISVASF